MKSFSKKNEFMPQQDMREADYYVSSSTVISIRTFQYCIHLILSPELFAEIDVGNKLNYRSAGCKGVVDVKVVTPEKLRVIFPDHHPNLCKFMIVHHCNI